MFGMSKWDVENIVRDMTRKEIGTFMEYRYCPKCADTLPMIKFEVGVGKETRGSFGRTVQATSNRYRCMGCLTLWDEYIGEIKE